MRGSLSRRMGGLGNANYRLVVERRAGVQDDRPKKANTCHVCVHV